MPSWPKGRIAELLPHRWKPAAAAPTPGAAN